MEQPSLEHIAEQQNHYVVHVAEMNRTTDVVSTQDIYNANGLLIVPKNTKISHGVADRILQHKLQQPFEEQIRFKNSLNTDGLRQDGINLLNSYPDLLQIHAALDAQGAIDGILAKRGIHAVLLQKLTVMRECLPREYEKALFCAWLSSLLATEARLGEEEVYCAYLGGLTHDIGLLHVSPTVLRKKETLTPEEWRVLQSHVVVSYLVLRNLAGANSASAKAVLEHHERCDGSGYPVGKNDEDLGMLGQIIGMADSLQAIRMHQFAESGRNLRDAMPYLHMNAHTHFWVIYQTMCSLLQKSGLQPSRVNPHLNAGSLVAHLSDAGKKLQDTVALLEQLLDRAEASVRCPCSRKLLRVLKPMVMMIQSSGLVRAELILWLDNLRDCAGTAVLDELLAIDLMQNELRWQIRNVCKTIHECSESEQVVSAPETKEHLAQLSSRINEYLSVEQPLTASPV